MGRAQRNDPAGAWHHIMSRGVDRQPIFFDVEDRLLFGDLIGETVDRFGIEIHAYCLMTNHFHLLVRCPRRGVSDAMQWLLSMFATHVNRRQERVGHLFGGRFISRLVTDVGYLANAVRYIHLNPVAIDGVERPDHYRWSSHRTYLALRPAPPWFETRTVSAWFSSPCDFHSFVCAPITTGLPASLRQSNASDLVDAIDLVLSELSPVRARGLMAQRRAIALTIAEASPESVRGEIYTALRISSGGAQRSARYRALRMRASDPLVDAMVDRTRLLFASDLATPHAA